MGFAEANGFRSEQIHISAVKIFPKALRKGNKMVCGVEKWSRGTESLPALFLVEKYI